jgi:hypothetical protein
VVAVTHDRYFLDNAAEWILELDRGQGIPWKGNYSSWLEQKQERLRQELREYWQLMGSCERLSAEMKAELGEALLPAILKAQATDVELWAFGRLGARAPMYGPLNCIVSRKIVARWAEALLKSDWRKPEPTVFMLVQLARCVADRERDLDETLRRRIAERIAALPGGRRAARLLTEFVPLEAQERARIMDESLPVGLRIRAEADAPSGAPHGAA